MHKNLSRKTHFLWRKSNQYSRFSAFISLYIIDSFA
nr:MAG TPA: hypothetical protein [Inoviridae sp.]